MMRAASSLDSDVRPTILLVEDHQDTRHMYAEFLRDRFEVVEAGDAPGALAILREHRMDLVITDLALPGVDGLELMTTIRADAALRHLSIICLSGYGGSTHDARARAAGCDHVLQKPCMPDALAAVADDLLRTKRAPPSSA